MDEADVSPTGLRMSAVSVTPQAAQFGVIGLGVMGEDLALKGFVRTDWRSVIGQSAQEEGR